MGRGSSGASGGGSSAKSSSLAAKIVAQFEKLIKNANSLDELDDIVERAANNDIISNEQYSAIYNLAMNKAKSWSPI